ncbi:VOC family protein [Bdellovibrio bacteriovorus]|uniref:VOC family protein n=1 Tax=Bdellovibrio bacteriovorus TaxID=959 RepID=UPI003AA8D174
MNEFNIAAQDFLQRVFNKLDAQNIQLDKHWFIDHLCYRVSSLENYNSFKTQFASFAELLIESDVNGRPIATYKFAEPIRFRDWSIQVVELPAPKPGKVTIEGFEHFEVVADIGFDEIKARYPSAVFSESGLKKEFNPELEISLDELAIKFHPLSLESVIRLEKNEAIHTAVKSSGVLKSLKEHQPLLVGTYPLGMNVSGSDVDVLINIPDLTTAETLLKKHFSGFENFKAETHAQYAAVTASFDFQGVTFEVFAQVKGTVKQNGNLHFLVEERLLHVGGSFLAEKILALRKAGDKTEPAFAKALNLSGNPYDELLRLQKLSESELRQLLK